MSILGKKHIAQTVKKVSNKYIVQHSSFCNRNHREIYKRSWQIGKKVQQTGGCESGASVTQLRVLPVLPSGYPTHQIEVPSWGNPHVSGVQEATAVRCCWIPPPSVYGAAIGPDGVIPLVPRIRKKHIRGLRWCNKVLTAWSCRKHWFIQKACGCKPLTRNI